MKSWHLEGKRVTGYYLNQFPVSGVVTLSRSKLGGTVVHYVDLDQPVKVFSSIREKVILNHSEVDIVEGI